MYYYELIYYTEGGIKGTKIFAFMWDAEQFIKSRDIEKYELYYHTYERIYID